MERYYQQKQLEQIKQNYKTLKQAIKENEIPQEWEILYDAYMRMLKESLANVEDKYFELEYNVEKTFYKQYFYEKDVYDGKATKYSPGKILNKYLAKTFKQEGYKNAKFKLTQKQQTNGEEITKIYYFVISGKI